MPDSTKIIDPTESQMIEPGAPEAPKRAPRPRGASNLTPVGISIAVAVLFRAYVAATSPCINRDGQSYLDMARDGLESGIGRMIADSIYHPLYALLVIPFVKIVFFGDYEAAGRATSIVFGAAAIIPLYYLTVDIARSRIAGFFATLVYAVSPYIVRVESAVFSEGAYIFFLSAAGYMGFRAMRDGRILYGAGAGASVALSYLTRPEGLAMGVALGAGLAVAASLSVKRERWSERTLRRITAGVACLCFFTVFFAPYMVILHEKYGEWILTPKFTAMAASGEIAKESFAIPDGRAAFPSTLEKYNKTPEITAEPGLGRNAASVFEVANELVIGSFYPFFILILLGAVFGRRAGCDMRGYVFLAGFAAVYLFIAFVRANAAGYVAHRHLVPLAALLSVFCGAGAVFICDLAKRAVTAERAKRKRGEIVLAVLAVVIVAAAAPKALKRVDTESEVAKAAGIWIKHNASEQDGQGRQGAGVMITSEPRVAFYAGAEYYLMETADYSVFRAFLLDPFARPETVVIEEGEKDYLGIIAGEKYDGLEPLCVFVSPNGKRRLHVFRVKRVRER